jgi:hypothetical protein
MPPPFTNSVHCCLRGVYIPTTLVYRHPCLLCSVYRRDFCPRRVHTPPFYRHPCLLSTVLKRTLPCSPRSSILIYIHEAPILSTRILIPRLYSQSTSSFCANSVGGIHAHNSIVRIFHGLSRGTVFHPPGLPIPKLCLRSMSFVQPCRAYVSYPRLMD